MNSDLTTTRQISRLLPLRDNSVGHWRFRGDLIDESAQSNDLTAVAIGSYISGGLTENVTTAILPTGPAGAAANIVAGSATDFDFGAGDFTIEIIAYTTSSSAMFLVDKNDGGTPLQGFFVGLGSGLIVARIGDGSNEVQGVSAGAVNDGRWHYIAVVVDRVNDEMNLYIDGIEDPASPFDISSVTGSISAASEDFQIGNQFDGGIDEIAVTPQALLVPEIASRAAGLLSPFVHVIPNELKGYFRQIDDNDAFDEFLIPHESPFAALRQKAKDIIDLVKFDQVPERHLPALASLFNFELPDANLLTLTERREMFKWITWLYQRKGTYLCVDKLIDLAGLTATTVNRFPSTIPFTLNFHRLFGYERAELILFTEDFSTNLSQWDPPLDPSVPWRLQNGGLYARVGIGRAYDRAILFDDSERSFYIEADIKMIDAQARDFGFYLAYQDEDNWLRIDKENAGSNRWKLYWSSGGVTGSDLLSSAWGSRWDEYSNGDTIKLWVHADLDAKTYTAGVDDWTIIYKETTDHPDITGTKKGLWLGNSAELEWDNVLLKNLRPELAATLTDDDYLDRTLDITYPGTSVESQKRKAYISAILPRYIPYGVIIEWLREVPVASRIGFRTGGVTVKSGFVLDTNRAARIGFRTAGITAIGGDIVRTPTASRMGFRTRIVGLTRDPSDSSRIGFRTATITTTVMVPLLAATFINPDTDPLTQPTHDLPDVTSDWTLFNELIDGNIGGSSVAGTFGADCSYVLHVASDGGFGVPAFNTILLHDNYVTEVNGLYSGSNNEIKRYDPAAGAAWQGGQLAASVTRSNNITTIDIGGTITVLNDNLYKIHMSDGALAAPDGTVLPITEIEFIFV